WRQLYIWLHVNASNRSYNVTLPQKSDAMLYAPSVDEIKPNCDVPSLKCYMLEVEMVLIEQQIDGNDSNAKCIFSFNDKCSKPNACGSCPPCEATALRNSTIFLDNLNNILSKIMSNGST
uniref:Interleukin n=1 Tax=Neogobius melanostomus TaxID=47308 RepID=A0A8C6TZB5_9GOBI